MFAHDCPTCRGMHLDGRARCPSCGHSLGDRLPVIPRWADTLCRRFAADRRPERLALVPAAIPLLLPFPLLALCRAAIAVARPAQNARPAGEARAWGPVVALSLLNLAISIWLLSALSREMIDALSWIWYQLPVQAPSEPGGARVFEA